MNRLANLLLFANRPGDDEFKEALKQAKLMQLPWEDPADARFIEPTKSKEQLQEEATEAIQSMCNTWVTGHEVVLKTLASFGATRLRDLPEDKLAAFIEALAAAPVDGSEPETNDPDDLV